MSDGESRQYIREAWQPYTLNCENEQILCNLNPEPGSEGDATLCLIPTQAKNVVADPASLKEKPNVMSQWLDRLTAAGASILLMHGEHYDDLQLLADRAANGVDGFALMEARLRAVIDDALVKGHTRPGRVVVLGSSRHGFAILHAMAENPAVSAAVAHQPVIHWPRMSEFTGMDNNEIVRRNSLFTQIERFPPRPLFIQTGYSDQRVGQEWITSLTDALKGSYADEDALCRLTHDMMRIPGHDGTRIPNAALDAVVPWLREQSLLY